ncbi:hypothetical protein Q9G86_27035 [Bacillus thuringiensis]|uniref:hypothetical protein n=1 Tax=Bacillus thuringiensis TaxID=1428 RepID=UPI00273A8ACC|nr:hypothetical protein [Bacillus thuringiensis]WLP64226.1 hypothetical protein Q9G86_27035 [Bacillus thuringiensis]
MGIIELFRDYIEDYHPHLAEKEWIVNVRTLLVTDIQNGDVKATIPSEVTGELKCWIFYYNGGTFNVVYLLQDKWGRKNIGIGLLKKGVLIKPIRFV